MTTYMFTLGVLAGWVSLALLLAAGNLAASPTGEPRRPLSTLRTWLAGRRERRRRGERARHNALLMTCGGTLTAPRKR